MSSSSIYASIVSCQYQIDNLYSSIAVLQRKIDEQQDVLFRFRVYREDYFSELIERKRRCDIVSGFRTKAVFSERFAAKRDDELGQDRANAVNDALDGIHQKMQDEINRHYQELDQQKTLLIQEGNRLEQLRIDHTRALIAEKP